MYKITISIDRSMGVLTLLRDEDFFRCMIASQATRASHDLSYVQGTANFVVLGKVLASVNLLR